MGKRLAIAAAARHPCFPLVARWRSEADAASADRHLGRPANVSVSAATAWEARIGKLPDALDVAADVAGCVSRERFQPLAVSIERAFDAYGVLRVW